MRVFPPKSPVSYTHLDVYKRQILEDPELDDPVCMQKIEAIVTVYRRRLGVYSTRHWEQD